MTNEDKVLEPHHTPEYLQAIERFMKQPSYANRTAKYKPVQTALNNNMRGGGRYRVEDIKRWLENPASSQQQLREFSNFLYKSNYLYKWFVSILSNMATWNWVMSMDTFGLKKKAEALEKSYRQGIAYANLKYSALDLTKAFKTAIREDWFYGYEIETDDSYFILKLDPQYCRVASIFEDGIRGFQFDFSYFDDKKEQGSGRNNAKVKNIIESYPEEFKKAYARYLRTGENWILLNPLNTVCWKLNDDLDEAIPYFATIFEALNDVGFYKELNKDRAEIDNFLLLHQYIPVDEEKVDKFAINLDLATKFDSWAHEILPEGVNMFTSPMKVTAVKTERSSNDKDNVKTAVEQAYSGAGVPLQLSNPTTAAALALAIKANEQVVYNFYRQVEKTVNFKIKYKFPSNKFKTRLLDATHFSKENKAKELLSGAQSGIVDPMIAASAHDINPHEFLNNLELSNNILGLYDKIRPLQTSYTMSSEDGAGAPTKDDGEISDSTEKGRETEANENRTV